MYNLRNFHIFQTENPCSLKYGLDAIPYYASQADSLALFTKIAFRLGNVQSVHVDLAKYYSKC